MTINKKKKNELYGLIILYTTIDVIVLFIIHRCLKRGPPLKSKKKNILYIPYKREFMKSWRCCCLLCPDVMSVVG
jgi:hypothetical protein